MLMLTELASLKDFHDNFTLGTTASPNDNSVKDATSDDSAVADGNSKKSENFSEKKKS